MKAEGEFAQVKKHLEIALDNPEAIFVNTDIVEMLVDIAAEHREVETLKKYLVMLEDGLDRINNRYYQGILFRSAGVLHTLQDEYGLAEEKLKEALGVFKDLNAPWQIGRTYYELGQLAGVQGEGKVAREHYENGLTSFEKMGAKPYMEKTRAAVESLG